MNLISPKIIKELLLKYSAKPSKGLGQNFLIDKNVLDKIIDSADIKKSDVILEVGPGMGVLTQELAQEAKKVIAVEKDKIMIEILKETLNGFNNVEIIQGDILKNKLQLPKKYKLVANIPYYLTSPLIRKFLESENQPQEVILMLQKEVAQRICSKPPEMSLLAVSVQFYAESKIISYVSKNCFWPSPKIDSAIIKIVPNKPFDSAQGKKQIQRDLFFEIVKAGFSHPRKQLVNNLTSLKSLNGVKLDKVKISNWLLRNNISPSQRSETLRVSDWANLTKSFYV
jgi:16S rRNA (adenine1518-N6/adenine1519-N6)-dimethyltransferase